VSEPIVFGGRQQECRPAQPVSTPSAPGIVRVAVAPMRRHLVLSRDFDLDVHNILDYTEHQLLEGEALDLDHVADLISKKVRESLHVVYGPGEER
jgi:hypothetical protein